MYMQLTKCEVFPSLTADSWQSGRETRPIVKSSMFKLLLMDSHKIPMSFTNRILKSTNRTCNNATRLAALRQ